MVSARPRHVVQPRAPRELRRARARRRGHDRHATRFLLAAALTAVLLVTLLLTAFGAWSAPAVAPQPLAAANVLPGGQPQPQIVSTVGSLQLQLPVAQTAVTAIGYHNSGDGSLALDPVGRQGNAGLFARIWHRLVGGKSDRLLWYQLRGGSGPGTSALAVGAAPGTDVYSPVDGTVVGITDFVLANRTFGARVDVRPHAAPSVVVSLTHLRADPALTVGSAVSKARSKVGVVVDVSSVERQALARYTQDPGQQRGAVRSPGRRALGSLKLLFIGDVVGAPGRRAVEERLRPLREELGADFCVLNGENIADGLGITPKLARRLLAAGADVITLGNHTWRRSEINAYLAEADRVIRPANYSPSAPGRGLTVAEAANGVHVAVINVLGSLFLEPAISMWELLEGLVEEARRQTPVIVVDVHAEATSEKVALARWLDGRVTAVLGTHTHVQTSDARVQPGGTAAITDVGMTGPHDSVIGVKGEQAIYRMRTGLPIRFETAEGGVRIEGALIECGSDGRATAIEAIRVPYP